MNPKDILEILNELRVLPYFPNDEYVMASLLKLVGSMCENEDQVRWLVNRMTSGIYSQWPGPQEMRACFCCRYKPKDGINAYSSVYPDGLPVDPTAPPRPGIAGPDWKALPPGEPVSQDAEMDRKVALLAQAKSIDRKRPAPVHQPMSAERRAQLQREIDREVERQREQRAKQEVEG